MLVTGRIFSVGVMEFVVKSFACVLGTLNKLEGKGSKQEMYSNYTFKNV